MLFAAWVVGVATTDSALDGVSAIANGCLADAEFATMRCHDFTASAALARQTLEYQVVRTPDTDMASDHFPIAATSEVLQ